jgi:hypothetical protein
MREMANNQVGHQTNLDRYIVIHVATTCDEHGVYVTKDSAEVIELGWILLNAKNLEEVMRPFPRHDIVTGRRHLGSVGHILTLAHVTDSPRECSCQASQHSDHSSLQYVAYLLPLVI